MPNSNESLLEPRRSLFSEQIENFGLPNLAEYDWKPRHEGFPVGVDSNPWLEYTWDTALEFALMMFDAHLYNNEPIVPHLHSLKAYLPSLTNIIAIWH